MIQTDDNFQAISNKVIEEHPNALKKLLASFRVFSEPTPDLLFAMSVKHGDSFINQLEDIDVMPKESPHSVSFLPVTSSFTGMEPSSGFSLAFKDTLQNLTKSTQGKTGTEEDSLVETETKKGTKEKPDTKKLFGITVSKFFFNSAVVLMILAGLWIILEIIRRLTK